MNLPNGRQIYRTVDTSRCTRWAACPFLANAFRRRPCAALQRDIPFGIYRLVDTSTLWLATRVSVAKENHGPRSATRRKAPPVLSSDYLSARVCRRLRAQSRHATLDALASTVKAMVTSELLQLARRDDPATTLAEAVAIAEKKTARLFAFAASEGARAGGAGERARRAIARFGLELGLAFQVLDDVLDLEPGTGKLPRKDLREGTLTLPVLLAR